MWCVGGVGGVGKRESEKKKNFYKKFQLLIDNFWASFSFHSNCYSMN